MAPATPAEVTQQQSQLRSLLSNRGFVVPDSVASDDQIADLLASELDSAISVRESDEFKKFQQWKAEQEAAAAKPAQPSIQPQQPSASDAELLTAVSSGYITFDATSKRWSATHPSFSSLAEAMTSRDERAQKARAELAFDPTAFIQKRIDEAIQTALKSAKPSAPEDVQQAVSEFRQQQVQAQLTQIESWASQNSQTLYDANGNPTPRYRLYETIYTDLTKADPSLDQRPLERHNEVLRRMQVAEQAFRPAAAAPVQQQAKPASFMASAAARRDVQNRLSDYTGPAKNSVGPQIPRGKGGIPSLQGIVNQMTTLSEN